MSGGKSPVIPLPSDTNKVTTGEGVMDTVQVIGTIKCGLEVWCVIHGRTLVHTFMSQQYAEQAAYRLRLKLQALIK